MEQNQIIRGVKRYVKNRLEFEGSGHDFGHIMRVYNTAMTIQEGEGGEQFVIALAALLHDIADHKFDYTDNDRRTIVSTLLFELGVEEAIVAEVVEIVNDISFKSGTNKKVMKTLSGKIVQDADRLDAIGAIGIARAFTYGGYKGRPLYLPKDDRGSDSSEDTISHFYEKLLLLKDKMNTETGRTMAEARHKYLETFLEEFYAEWDGAK